MILNGGELDGVRVLSPKSVERFTTDASGNLASLPLGPGTGFSLGFQVITDLGLAAEPGSNGTISWSGIYGTNFWVDPKERLLALVMVVTVRGAQRSRVIRADLLRLQDTSAQIRVRGAIVLMIAFAAVAAAREHEEVFACVGRHPNGAAGFDEAAAEAIEDDPFVRELVRDLGAEVVPSSIRPAEDAGQSNEQR